MSFIGTSIIQDAAIAPISQQKSTGVEGEVYEVFRVEGKKPLFIADHLQRLERSLATAGKQLPIEISIFKELLDWLLICNPITDANIRVSLLPDGTFQAGFVRSRYPDAHMYATGVATMLINRERTNPSAKVYQQNMRQEAEKVQREKSVYETILVNHNNEITEGSRSNIFFVNNNTLITAPDNTVLQGIMRSKVIDCARNCNIAVYYRAVKTQDIENMDAAFITGTSPRILPIKSIDERLFDINNQVMRQLMRELDSLIKA